MIITEIGESVLIPLNNTFQGHKKSYLVYKLTLSILNQAGQIQSIEDE